MQNKRKRGTKNMENVLGNILLGVDEGVANLQLPDPVLRDYYRDEEDRFFWIDSEIDQSTLDLVKLIMRCNKEDKGKPVENRKPITVFIDSPGGSVEVLYAIVRAMMASKTPIRTVNYCTCFSAASEILAAGTKGYRYCMPGSMVMCHVGSMQIGGTIGNVEATKKFCDELCKKCTDMFLDNTKIDAKTWKKKTGSNSDWYLFETEALEYGIVDKIINDYDELF
jgi:ATP-dependent Clp protease protease subunit